MNNNFRLLQLQSNCYSTSTEPTICHAGQQWYNRTESKYTTKHNTRFSTGI